MTGIRFENVLNWGNIITLGFMGVGGLWAFSQVQSEVAYMRESMIELRQDADTSDVRLRTLELGFGRVEEKLNGINANQERTNRILEQFIERQEGQRP
jgi:hypothetical protein